MDLPVISESDPRLAGIKNLYLATNLGQLDVLGELPGVCSFEDLLNSAESIDIGGDQYKLISPDTLIQAKRAAGRPHDLRTLSFLEQIKRGRTQT